MRERAGHRQAVGGAPGCRGAQRHARTRARSPLTDKRACAPHETAARGNAPCPVAPIRSAQDDEGKRRRLSTEDVRAASLPGAAAAAAPCPSTSGTSADGSSASCATSMAGQQPQPLTRQVEEMLRAYLLRWGQRLVDLQPKVGGGASPAMGVACMQPACAVASRRHISSNL